MQFSKRINSIQPSLTRKLFDMAKNYNNVIDLTLGDPDIQPSDNIKNAACNAIKNGNTRYSNNLGLYEVRKSIAQFNSKLYNKNIKPEEIMVSVGGMESIYLILSCLLNQNDQVIIFGPYWINYVQMTKICGGIPIIISSKQQNNFIVDINDVKQKITEKTKLIIINSPSNPSGTVFTKQFILELAKLAIQKNIFVISDQVYKSLIYNGQKYFSIFEIPQMKDLCAVVDSMSKRFSMTGYRLGYTIANEQLIKCMGKLQQNVAACAPLPSQYAALEAYNNNQNDDNLFNEFLKRRNIVLEEVQKIKVISIKQINSTFYAFINISKCNLNSIDFAIKLLQNQQVAVVPGITYGKEYDNFIRIAFTLNCDKIKQAFKRIKKFIYEDLKIKDEE